MPPVGIGEDRGGEGHILPIGRGTAEETTVMVVASAGASVKVWVAEVSVTGGPARR